jgi:plastocyanin
MSIWGYRVTSKLITVGVLVVLVGALVTVTAAVNRSEEREITLVARGMAFYLLGDPTTPNPTITVNAGERVRIVLRNDDRGMTHDFAVPAVDAALDPIDWNEQEDVAFDVPATPGRYEYMCRPHMLMMRGLIVVR